MKSLPTTGSVPQTDKAQTIKELPSKDAYSFMQTKPHVTAMLKAIAETGMFTIERSEETARAWHTKSGREVFAAISKGHGQPWIIRHHKLLFS